MITDLAIDQALIELKRTEKALMELRKTRRLNSTDRFIETNCWTEKAQHAAAKRASMDLTRKLAALRGGR